MSTSTILVPLTTFVLGVGTTLVTSTTTHLLEGKRYRRSRQDEVARALLDQRSAAYRKFIQDAHLTAQALGEHAAADQGEDAEGRREALTRLDRAVVPGLYELELYASDPVLREARRVRSTLREFRETVAAGATYKADTYEAALQPYRDARAAFLEAARLELLAS